MQRAGLGIQRKLADMKRSVIAAAGIGVANKYKVARHVAPGGS
jgi:hypothetical protein